LKTKPKNRITIFDTTLRDGEQTPGVALTPTDKLVVAKQLDKLGVDIIEAGFPISSKGEEEAFRLITKESFNAEICGLARTSKKDIDAALKLDVDSIHVFIATSDIHLKYKLKLSRKQVLEKTAESVEYAKSHGVIVEFSAEDATRTELPFLKKVYGTAIAAGADRINVPDTVGVMSPGRINWLFHELSKVVKLPISAHCHNDFGLAVANSLAAVEAGASQIHVAINGLGERAGNAALEEVVMALHLLYKKPTHINTKYIYETSKLVQSISGVRIQPNKAIVGENAFAHEAGIHTHAVSEMPLTYEPISAELVGRRSLLTPGKHAGRHGLMMELKELGLSPNETQMRRIISQVKAFSDRGKLVTTTDLLSIATKICGIKVDRLDGIIDLRDLTTVTGSNIIPTTSVKLIIEGKEYVSSETGIGPVDAAIRAIQKITDNLINIRLKEFRLDALTGGSDAVAEVIVKVEDAEGRVVSARAAKPDIVLASVEALINGMNRLLQLRKLSQAKK